MLLYVHRLAPIIDWASGNNKQWIIGETGWSAEGFDKDSNAATAENQALYFRAFYCKAKDLGWAYYWFTGVDNDWRIDQALAEGDETTVEGRFGIFHSDLTLKEHYRNLNFSCPFPADATRYYFQVNGTSAPVDNPTLAVTELPTSRPTVSSEQPTPVVSVAPTESLTDAPTTVKPSSAPTVTTLRPSAAPTPTDPPTIAPAPVSDPTNPPVSGSPTDVLGATFANAESGSLSGYPWGTVVIAGKWGGLLGLLTIFVLL